MRSFVNLDHARTKEQVAVMEQIEKDGVCPFCMEHFRKYHTKPILKENTHWIATTNMSPYEGSVYHFLFICKEHSTMPYELSDIAKLDLFSIINVVIKEFNIDGGAILIRFGNMQKTGGSVDHFHAHLIVGDTRAEDSESLKVKVGYKKAK